MSEAAGRFVILFIMAIAFVVVLRFLDVRQHARNLRDAIADTYTCWGVDEAYLVTLKQAEQQFGQRREYSADQLADLCL